MNLSRDASELGAIIPPALRAAKLTPQQLSLYIYLVLQPGKELPETKVMAEACMMTAQEIKQAGEVLKQRGMIEVVKATGFDPCYHITAPSRWLPPEPEAKPAGKPEHAAFIDLWVIAYEKVFGDKYRFQDAKDGSATKALLMATKMTPEALMAIAVEAWKHPDWFNCKAAATIAGFNCRFNEIRHELKNPPHAHKTASRTDRNTGTNNDGRAKTFEGVGRVQAPLRSLQRPAVADDVPRGDTIL